MTAKKTKSNPKKVSEPPFVPPTPYASIIDFVESGFFSPSQIRDLQESANFDTNHVKPCILPNFNDASLHIYTTISLAHFGREFLIFNNRAHSNDCCRLSYMHFNTLSHGSGMEVLLKQDLVDKISPPIPFREPEVMKTPFELCFIGQRIKFDFKDGLQIRFQITDSGKCGELWGDFKNRISKDPFLGRFINMFIQSRFFLTCYDFFMDEEFLKADPKYSLWGPCLFFEEPTNDNP